MADSTQLTGLFQPTAVVSRGSQAQRRAEIPLAASNDARARDAQTRAAVDRLGSLLTSDAVPRADAPRGTYLNITA